MGTGTLSLLLACAATLAACTSAKTSWTPTGERIRTVWGENLNPAAVHPEYPRPQMVRSEYAGSIAK